MITLTIRTDKPEAEIGLFDDEQKLDYVVWEGHRQLATSIHKKIEDLLSGQKLNWDKIEGIVCYKGPGSFTGLRIGLTVGNTMATTLDVPIVGMSGEKWTENGIKSLNKNHNDKIVIPEYGQEAHVTEPKK